jgi:dynactin-5
MKIGDFVHIGANTIIEAATIGNHVEIGKNCVIVSGFLGRLNRLLTYSLYPQGKFTIIKDCTKIADNTIIPPNTVIPALTLFAGSPGARECTMENRQSHVFSI